MSPAVPPTASAAAARMWAPTPAHHRRVKPLKRAGRPPLLAVPQDAVQPFEIVSKALTPAGRRRFLDELHEALESSPQAFRDVMSAWLRTFIVRLDGDYEEDMARAGDREAGNEYSTKELRRALNL